MMSHDEAQARIDLTAALRSASRLGLGEGICNHFSLALPGAPGHFLINPQGLHWSEITPGDLVVVDAQGRKVSGKHSVEPTAFFIHSAIHRGRANAACVMHTHMPHATALACLADYRFAMLELTEDKAESHQAWRERRKPTFKGR